MRQVFSSLRLRLMLLVFLPLLPSLGLICYTTAEDRHRATTEVQAYAVRMAHLAALYERSYIEGAKSLLVTVAHLPEVQNADPDACDMLLGDLLKQYPQYINVGAATADGDVFCTGQTQSAAIPTANLSNIQYLVQPRGLGEASLYVDRSVGKAEIELRQPIIGAGGQVKGFVFIILDFSWLDKFIAEAQMPTNTSVRVIHESGTVLLRYPNLAECVGCSISRQTVISTVLSQREGVFAYYPTDLVPTLFAFTPLSDLPGVQMYVNVGLPTAVAFAQVDWVFARNLLALGIITLVACITAWGIGDVALLRKVKRLCQQTEQLTNGDLTVRSGLDASDGELGQLACAFNRLGAALEQRESECNQIQGMIRRRNQQLEGLMNAMSEAIQPPLEASRVVEVALRGTLTAMEFDAGFIFLECGGTWKLATCRGFDLMIEHAFRGMTQDDAGSGVIAEWAHADGVHFVSNETLPAVLRTQGLGFPVLITVPITSPSRVFGVMVLTTWESRSLEPCERNVLALVNQQIGVAIEDATLYEQVQCLSTLKERERLSRELHDGIAQVLGSLCMRNKTVTDLVTAGEAERAAAQLQEMQGVMQEAYQDVRESILGLRVTVSPNGGFVSTLKEYAHRFGQQTGIRVNLVSNSDDRIEYAPEVEVQLLRIIQEALTNARKHSEAKQAWIRFEPQAESVVVTIEDDGRGFDPASVNPDGQQNFGLQTMRERAEGVGGSVQVSSQPGQGTKIVVRLPCNRGGE